MDGKPKIVHNYDLASSKLSLIFISVAANSINATFKFVKAYLLNSLNYRLDYKNCNKSRALLY